MWVIKGSKAVNLVKVVMFHKLDGSHIYSIYFETKNESDIYDITFWKKESRDNAFKKIIDGIEKNLKFVHIRHSIKDEI